MMNKFWLYFGLKTELFLEKYKDERKRGRQSTFDRLRAFASKWEKNQSKDEKIKEEYLENVISTLLRFFPLNLTDIK